MKKIIAFPHKPGAGGPGSFQKRFENELKKNGYIISYLSDKNIQPNLIFIVGGTKKIWSLLKWKLRGVPIIFRLDGINWLHRVKKARQSNISNFIKCELINFVNKIIHSLLANHIVYQSTFVKNWWDKEGFAKRRNYSIIHNGVDLNKFKNPDTSDLQYKKLVILEGLIDYSPYAIDLINELSKVFGKELEVYGGIHYKTEKEKLKTFVNYKGKIESEDVHKVYKNSIYISLDINPACPNTVVEALACGSPVVGFDTGAIKELLDKETGICVEYGSNPWKLDYPDTKSLIYAIKEIKENFIKYSQSARNHAVQNYSIEHITKKYIETINILI